MGFWCSVMAEAGTRGEGRRTGRKRMQENCGLHHCFAMMRLAESSGSSLQRMGFMDRCFHLAAWWCGPAAPLCTGLKSKYRLMEARLGSGLELRAGPRRHRNDSL